MPMPNGALTAEPASAISRAIDRGVADTPAGFHSGREAEANSLRVGPLRAAVVACTYRHFRDAFERPSLPGSKTSGTCACCIRGSRLQTKSATSELCAAHAVARVRPVATQRLSPTVVANEGT